MSCKHALHARHELGFIGDAAQQHRLCRSLDRIRRVLHLLIHALCDTWVALHEPEHRPRLYGPPAFHCSAQNVWVVTGVEQPLEVQRLMPAVLELLRLFIDVDVPAPVSKQLPLPHL